jgi:hypothetical protein
MPSIEVDFDVFKALTAMRPSEEVTENDVLRGMLNLPPKTLAPASSDGPAPGDWVAKGVRFPAGTEFRAKYKGETYLARVEGGALVLNGEAFDSPSNAAMAITKSPVNGWVFWECRLPGRSRWQMIKSLRK